MRKMLYSEILDKYYSDKEEAKLIADEKAYREKMSKVETEKAQRKTDAEAVNSAFEKVDEAMREADQISKEAYSKVKERRDEANAILKDFCDKHGSYHVTLSSPLKRTNFINSFMDIFSFYDF